MTKGVPLKANPDIEPEVIRRKLAMCRQRDRRGAYRLHPCLGERELRRLERRYRMQLPEDYRQFLTQVGNGGVGPCSRFEDCEELRSGILRLASKPFPHAKAWNLPRSFFANIPPIEEGDEEASEQRYQAYLDQYWDNAHIQGSLPFYDQGCNYCLLLVLNGPERGTVWTDERADDAGVLPIRLDPAAPAHRFEQEWVRDHSRSRGHRVTFGMLYNWWLDRNLLRLRVRWAE